MEEDYGVHMDRKEANRRAGKEATVWSFINRLRCFNFITTVSSSVGVGSDKSSLSEKSSWKLYGGQAMPETQAGQLSYSGDQVRIR